MTGPINRRPVHDLSPSTETSLQEVIEGLQHPVKQLPCKLFYDARGSELFDRISKLEEYYPTLTELEIMRERIREICACIGAACFLVEYGSGSGIKTQYLLNHLEDPVAYASVEISRDALVRSTLSLAAKFPQIEILPICADYTESVTLPRLKRPYSKKVVYFPGSTIGNFHPHDAATFLQQLAEITGVGGAVLIGVDLKKDPLILHNAYNDQHGVTAEFNLNMLRRLNSEIDTNFDLDQFQHHAFYNAPENRVEMHLVSLANQEVRVNGTKIPFEQGETIWTENSYKYTLKKFEDLANSAGFEVEQVWTDPRGWFSVQYLTVT